MNEKDKKEFIVEFKKSDGTQRLDLWEYVVEQQVIWDQIITEMQKIAHEQGVDKKLEKLMNEDLKEA